MMAHTATDGRQGITLLDELVGIDEPASLDETDIAGDVEFHRASVLAGRGEKPAADCRDAFMFKYMLFVFLAEVANRAHTD
jgi:hypothetical protein